ncbi:unnamed protein product [Diplocarpon coronariae]
MTTLSPGGKAKDPQQNLASGIQLAPRDLEKRGSSLVDSDLFAERRPSTVEDLCAMLEPLQPVLPMLAVPDHALLDSEACPFPPKPGFENLDQGEWSAAAAAERTWDNVNIPLLLYRNLGEDKEGDRGARRVVRSAYAMSKVKPRQLPVPNSSRTSEHVGLLSLIPDTWINASFLGKAGGLGMKQLPRYLEAATNRIREK